MPPSKHSCRRNPVQSRKKVCVTPAEARITGTCCTHFILKYLHDQSSDELWVNSRESRNSEVHQLEAVHSDTYVPPTSKQRSRRSVKSLKAQTRCQLSILVVI